MFYFPSHKKFLPHPLLTNKEGILAVGGDIDAQTLLLSYTMGVFPWYNDEPVIWWYTHPRCVLFPSELKVQKSMRPYFNQQKFTVSFNTQFKQVIKHCKRINRKDQEGTWLNKKLIKQFNKLHKNGFAQSVEVWEKDELVGGLYGLKIGNIFFGESMFSYRANASKFGFISLVQKLSSEGVFLIDCQQETEHLKSMGARSISKTEFWKYLQKNWFFALEKPMKIAKNQK